MNERILLQPEKNPEEWELAAILRKGENVLRTMKEVGE
jgi:hypothetical protein